MTRITLLTDFGTADGYVAAMKGVLASEAPAAGIDDAALDIPFGDVASAAWALARYWQLYPTGTIHLTVVDPGVGGPRRPLAAEMNGRYFVAPDNGVLSRVLDAVAAARLVEIRNPDAMRETVSRTFHGRDVFAPAAAWLARGQPLEELGPPVSDPVLLAIARPQLVGDAVAGEVVHVDRFGNLITNIPEEWLADAAGVRMGDRDLGPIRRIYGDVAPGEPVALVGSAGVLEVAVREGSAAAVLKAGVGMVVEVWPRER